ncbi:MAG: F0F1 ATP synthase subunit B [Pseudonocardia sp.]|nr:F0F1 ATP synthase subunit B [Pseudonocardia sp.]
MATTIAEIVGFIVVLFVLYRYVWPVLKKMLDERQDLIQRQVDEAEQAEKDLAEAKRKHDSAVAEAEQEASRIRDAARAAAPRIREELQEQADADVERIKARGQEQLAAQRDQSVRGLRTEISGLSMQLAQRMIADSMADVGQKEASVDAFLEELNSLDELDGLGRRDASTAKQPAQAGGGVS